jgi:hypothetical protein
MIKYSLQKNFIYTLVLTGIQKKIWVHRTEIETISNQELPQLQKHVKY